MLDMVADDDARLSILFFTFKLFLLSKLFVINDRMLLECGKLNDLIGMFELIVEKN